MATGRPIERGPLDGALSRPVENGLLAQTVGIAGDLDGRFYEGAFGWRDREGRQPVGFDTVFWIGSLTKVLTSTAALQLIEQGRLSLDQPAGEILGYLSDAQVLTGMREGVPQLRPAARPITVRHLLTHTSGFTYSLWNPLMEQFEASTSFPFVGESLERALHAPLVFDPGDRWEYGISTDQVGRLIEEVSGVDLQTYLSANILEPLQMTDTGFRLGSSQRERLATAHLRGKDGKLSPIPYEMSETPEFLSGGGGAFSTPDDYFTLLQMLLGRGALRGTRVLTAESVELMRQGAIGDLQTLPMIAADSNSATIHDVDLRPGRRHTWGLSFDIDQESESDGRSLGTASWCGLLNLYFWIDFEAGIAGSFSTQTLPFPDVPSLEAAREFERRVYSAIDSG